MTRSSAYLFYMIACRLWHEGSVVLIDVSQSVETDHPRALEFLRMDATNVTDYFRRAHGVPVMTPRELFDFIVHASLPDSASEEAYLADALARAEARGSSGTGGDGLHETPEAEVAHGVFMASFIPQSLAGVRDVEADVDKLKRGDTAELYYGALTGVMETGVAHPQQKDSAFVSHASGSASAVAASSSSSSASKVRFEGDTDSLPPASASAVAVDSSAACGRASSAASSVGAAGDASHNRSGNSDSDEDSESGSESDSDDDEEEGEKEGAGGDKDAQYKKKFASKEDKRAHKAAIKEANREKRKNKIPKAVKKRAAKTKGGHK